MKEFSSVASAAVANGGSTNASALASSPNTSRRRFARFQRSPILGSWQLGCRLGGGSCSDVYAARPVDADAECEFDYAIKCLREPKSAGLSELQRFRNEVILGRRLEHANLVAILCASIESAPLYYVMPRLGGATLEATLQSQRQLPFPDALWITRQVADALSAIHQESWVHGDIQPANIHVSQEGHVTVIDLGCASPVKALDGNRRKILAGCLRYVAPEQLTSRYQTTPASDVYSLGIVLYEMLTGQQPSGFGDPARTAEFHLRETPPSIRTWLPTAPRELARLVGSMLAKDPARRPSTSGELQSKLARLEIETFTMR
jgi:serine/threonine-protein kinase